MSARTGWRALPHSRRTVPGVSSPESVVRSMHSIARSSQAACHCCLTVRRPGSVATRRSTALRLMRMSSIQPRSSAQPGFRSACAAGASTAACPFFCSFRRVWVIPLSLTYTTYAVAALAWHTGYPLGVGTRCGYPACPSIHSGRAAVWYFIFLVFLIFALVERKNEKHQEDKVPLCRRLKWYSNATAHLVLFRPKIIA